MLKPLEHAASSNKRNLFFYSTLIMITLWAAMHFQFSSATARVVHDQRQSSGKKVSMELKAPFNYKPQQTAVLHRQLSVVRTGSDAGLMIRAARLAVGSSPPSCIKRCGSCSPCKSVLVPIRTTITPSSATDYYPVAWKCQCGGKIYDAPNK